MFFLLFGLVHVPASIPTSINQFQLPASDLLMLPAPFPVDVLGTGRQAFIKSIFEIHSSLTDLACRFPISAAPPLC